jgi:putative phage-type endonuclease
MTDIGPMGVELVGPKATREEWLAARRSGVGASEVAQVLGESTWGSPYSLWASKLGRVADQPQTVLQAYGLDMESPIAAIFADKHPEYELLTCGLVGNRERPWEVATPDRLLVDPTAAYGWGDDLLGLLELKTAYGERDWGPDGTDDIPVAYNLQVQWQMEVTGAPYCWVAVLIGDNDYREYLVQRDGDVIAYLVEEVSAFWHNHVLADVPPAVDGHEATTRALRGVPVTGEVAESDRLVTLRDAHWELTNAIKAAEEELGKVDNEARAILGGAVVGAYAGRQYVTHKPQRGRETCDIAALRRDHPEIAEKYVRRGDEFRVLRFSKVGS